MEFITNTKPLIDSVKLGIIPSNITNFHKKSNVVQVSATNNVLTLNIESLRICTEITLRGKGEGDPASIFVSSIMFKNLIETLDNSVTTFVFDDNCLYVKSGKSKFTLPKIIDSDEFDLTKPERFMYNDSDTLNFNPNNWEYVKNNQMYAISMAPLHPVYMKVWVGSSGDVLVGDFDISLFTHSMKSDIENTCLLTDTVINLFTSLPEDAKIVRRDRDYLIQLSGDSYSYTTQLTPLYEDDEGVGSYSSDMILSIMEIPDTYNIVPLSPIKKLLSQADLLSSDSDTIIRWSVDHGQLLIQNDDVKGTIDVGGSDGVSYNLDFKLDYLRKIFNTYSDEEVSIGLISREGDDVGIVVWDGDLTTVLAGCE